MQFCLWKLLIVCCSTYQQSENTLFHYNPPSNLLRTVFSEFWWGLSRFLISLVWTQFYLWKFLRICCSTCQRSENSLFQWNSPVFCSDQCFLDFSEGFRKKWFHLPRRSSVCKSCSVFVAELVKEAKTCCCVGILKVFCSDQCFLYFGAEFQENYWMPLFSIDLSGEFQSFLIARRYIPYKTRPLSCVRLEMGATQLPFRRRWQPRNGRYVAPISFPWGEELESSNFVSKCPISRFCRVLF